MGCDIHVRVEYKAPGETVALKDGNIHVVPAEGLEGAPRWVPAEKLTPKEEVEFNKYYLARLDDPDVKKEWDEKPSLELAYEDVWYRGRDYMLFACLAGVRGESPLDWEPRGWPDDASAEVMEEIEGWDADGHSHSYQTLAELLEVDWVDALSEPGFRNGNPEWNELLERMRDLAVAECDGDETAVRIVYFFDN